MVIPKFFLLILLSFIFSGSPGQTNNLVFHHLNKEKGFSQSVCNDVFKDSRGFIWISTISGLFRFDGIDFLDVTRNNDKLKGHWLSEIREDSKGNLWLGKHDDELVKYDREKDSFRIISLGSQIAQQKLAAIFIQILYIDEHDRIWFLLNGTHLGVYDINAGRLKIAYNSPRPSIRYHIYFDTVNILHSVIYTKDDKNKRLLRGHFDSTLALVWTASKQATFNFNNFSVLTDKENIWSTQDGQLVHYNWGSGELETFVFSKQLLSENDNICYIIRGYNQQLWIRTVDGICSFDTKRKMLVNNFVHDPGDPFSISPGVIPIMCDNNNVLWMISWGKGVDYCNLGSFKFTHVLTAEASAKKDINNFTRAMACDDMGNVYVSTENSGIILLDSNGQFIRTILKQDGTAFEYIFKDSQGKIWMGNDALCCYDPATASIIIRMQENKNMRFTSITERKNGDLLLGTYDHVFLFNRAQKKIKEITGIRGSSAYVILYLLENEDLLTFQKDHGVTLYKNSDGNYKPEKIIDAKLYVKSLLRIAPDTLWLATTTGIFAYIISQKKITAIENLNDKLPNHYVYSILKGPKDYYWASTNSGLFRWKPVTGEYKSFGKEFGLQDLEFNTNAFCTLKNGNLMFGGVNGINIINPGIPEHFVIPKANLQLLSVNADKKRNLAWRGKGLYSDISIPPGNSAIEIEYDAIDFFNPQKIKVQYRLKNYNDGWITGDNAGIARFVNVKPGNYHFEIMVSDTEGNWKKEIKNLDIYFKPFWWQTGWFKLGLISCIVLVLVYGIRLFVKNRLAKQKQVLERAFAIQNERERIMTDLHDDIGATLSSMNIYGDLAGNIWDTRPQESRKMIEKISVTSKDLISRMGDIIWSMKPADEERYTLEPRLKNYSNELLAPKNIICDIDIDATLAASIINPHVRKNILLIVKEAINNIAKYSEASKAAVVFKQENASAFLTISDNGKGYDSQNIKHGNGLQNMLQRCTLLNGTCAFNTVPGEGTTIICSFPIATISHTI